jgi:DNA invertase Pin-like site-specific DNA recombinase
MGHAMFQIQNVFSELERKLISERTKAGLEAARRQGKILGRPRRLTDTNIAWARRALATGTNSTVDQLAMNLKVSPRTLRRALSISNE